VVTGAVAAPPGSGNCRKTVAKRETKIPAKKLHGPLGVDLFHHPILGAARQENHEEKQHGDPPRVDQDLRDKKEIRPAGQRAPPPRSRRPPTTARNGKRSSGSRPKSPEPKPGKPTKSEPPIQSQRPHLGHRIRRRRRGVGFWVGPIFCPRAKTSSRSVPPQTLGLGHVRPPVHHKFVPVVERQFVFFRVVNRLGLCRADFFTQPTVVALAEIDFVPSQIFLLGFFVSFRFQGDANRRARPHAHFTGNTDLRMKGQGAAIPIRERQFFVGVLNGDGRHEQMPERHCQSLSQAPGQPETTFLK
jgi:hypothetical protein